MSRSVGLVAAALLCSLLAACQRDPDLPPLPPASLSATQSQALARMNEAGASSFAGWTWRYEFGNACRVRVVKRYEGRVVPPSEYSLSDHYIEIVPYPGAGFGVKAYPRSKPGSADLFDARDEAQARGFAADVERLLAPCQVKASPKA
jgi:hypothetical protein